MRHHALKQPVSFMLPTTLLPATWLLTTVLVAPLASTVIASDLQVYRWKDANGKYHFSDHKPAASSADKVTIDAPAPKPNPELEQYRQKTRDNLATIDAERAETQREAQTQKIIAARQERSCTALRNAMRVEEQVAVLYTLDTSGEMQHLTDEQRTRYKNDLHSQWQRYCGN